LRTLGSKGIGFPNRWEFARLLHKAAFARLVTSIFLKTRRVWQASAPSPSLTDQVNSGLKRSLETFLLDFRSFYGMAPSMTSRKNKIARLPFNIRECAARRRRLYYRAMQKGHKSPSSCRHPRTDPEPPPSATTFEQSPPIRFTRKRPGSADLEPLSGQLDPTLIPP
jgi:hypothetical protein